MRDIYLNKKCASHVKLVAIFAFHDSILLGGVGTCGMVNNATISAKSSQGFLDKVKGIVCVEDFGVVVCWDIISLIN